MPRGSTLRASWLIAAAILVIAAETRFLGLSIRSLWFDEAFSVNLAQHSVPYILRFLPYKDSHPPLYYVLLNGWVHLFGSSENAVRGFSALVGFLTVPLLYAFARQVADGEVSLVAAALLAGSAFATVAAQEARMYPLLGLLALASWLSLRLAVQHRKAWAWTVYVASSALMLYTHYFGFLVLGSQVLYLIPLARRDRRALIAAAMGVGTTAALFLPWVPAFVLQATSGRGWPTFRAPVDLRAALDLLAQYGFGGELLGTGGYFHGGVLPLWQETLIVLPLVLLVGAGAYALWGERAWCLACYWAAPAVMAGVLTVWHNVFYARYFSFLAPPFALLMAVGIGVVAKLLPRVTNLDPPARSAVMAGFVVALLFANMPVSNGYRFRHAGEYNWRGAAAVVSSKAGANDYLLFVPGFAHIPFEYYYKGSLERHELTPIEVYRMARVDTPPDPKVDNAWARKLAAAHPRVWVVATVPMTPSSYHRLGDLLGGSFAPWMAWDFNDVYVFSLTSRRYGEGTGSQ